MQTSALLRLPEGTLIEIVKAVTLRYKGHITYIYRGRKAVRSIYTKHARHTPLLGLALTSRLFYKITIDWIYKTNTFHFPSPRNDPFTHFFAQIGAANVRQITSLEFAYLPTEEEWDVLWQFSNLRSLCLCFVNKILRQESLYQDLIEVIPDICQNFSDLRCLTISAAGNTFNRLLTGSEVRTAQETLKARHPHALLRVLPYSIMEIVRPQRRAVGCLEEEHGEFIHPTSKCPPQCTWS